MKNIILYLLLVLVILALPVKSFATYDPHSVRNNEFGIHILSPDEISEAANLVNSNGGDWGYVTVPIQASDKDLVKWQKFMDDCRKLHVIPIIRLATTGDYFVKASWSKPSSYDILDFANFLNSLDWPTKNRYVIVYNEQNRGDEWGGVPDAADYAQILDYVVDAFKEKSSDFFILAGGLDNASINIPGQSVNQFTYMTQMQEAVPGIFSKIDGLSAHAYPNPAFSAPPSNSRTGIYSFYFQNQIVYEYTGKYLPIFITETGWTSDNVSLDTQASYYSQAFKDYWSDSNVVAVTPFILNAEQGSFAQFSFIKTNQYTKIYEAYKNFSKVKGQPQLTKSVNTQLKINNFLPTEKFDPQKSINSVFKSVNNSSKRFFKWLLNV